MNQVSKHLGTAKSIRKHRQMRCIKAGRFRAAIGETRNSRRFPQLLLGKKC